MPKQDPRATITEESFAIDPQLLGLPLARPGRRAAAMALDLVIIALLVNAGGLLFGLAAAWVFLRVSAGSGGGLLRRSWRLAFRSMAAVTLFVVALGAWSTWVSDRPSSRPPATTAAMGGPAGGNAGTSRSVRRARAVAAEAPSPGAADSLLELFTAARAAGDSAALAELRAPLAAALAADTLRSLARRWESAAAQGDQLRAELDEARAERGILSVLRAAADDLGLTLGWSGLYFTAFLALWSGQTPGKRIMRIRVVRLDGKPMTWWAAFERFGGYAASIFTGLLGFLQILWDRNRQGMHDKITETVVVCS